MNLIGLHNIPFKEKRILVAAACQMFRKLNMTREFIKQKRESDGLTLNDIVIDANRETFKSISLFTTLLNLLSEEHRLIITNEFIEESNTNWYETHWSKTTYYKYKHEAVDAFLFLFYV